MTATPVPRTQSGVARVPRVDAADGRPLVVHVVYRFDIGGLENGVVNLINRMPVDAYRHAVIALTEVTDFRHRVTRDVEIIALAKPPGHGFALYPTLFRIFRRLRPAIVHTRNLASLEAAVPAFAAGVPVRIHGEHGRDEGDLRGDSRKHQWLRRAHRPFVTHYVALSRDLRDYLHARIGVPAARISHIHNGVDTERFAPPAGPRVLAAGDPFVGPEVWRVGSVGRMQAVKDPLNLVDAFLRARELRPGLRDRMRLIMVGDGPLREKAQARLAAAGATAHAWLPGSRDDIPAVLSSLDCFVLPSRAEGISNTILEAMASEVPVVATDVGGNAELVVDGITGALVPPGDAEALAEAIARLADDPDAARRAGEAGGTRARAEFSLDAMVARYRGLYDVLRPARPTAATLVGGVSR